MKSTEFGTVKWFNVAKRFGFIRNEAGNDIFVHQSDIESGFDLKEGDKVEFELGKAQKGVKAIHVKIHKVGGNMYGK